MASDRWWPQLLSGPATLWAHVGIPAALRICADNCTHAPHLRLVFDYFPHTFLPIMTFSMVAGCKLDLDEVDAEGTGHIAEGTGHIVVGRLKTAPACGARTRTTD
jgi:hypothetical protein